MSVKKQTSLVKVLLAFDCKQLVRNLNDYIDEVADTRADDAQAALVLLTAVRRFLGRGAL